jgi:hypothetical protein
LLSGYCAMKVGVYTQEHCENGVSSYHFCFEIVVSSSSQHVVGCLVSFSSAVSLWVSSLLPFGVSSLAPAAASAHLPHALASKISCNSQYARFVEYDIASCRLQVSRRAGSMKPSRASRR